MYEIPQIFHGQLRILQYVWRKGSEVLSPAIFRLKRGHMISEVLESERRAIDRYRTESAKEE